MGGGSQCESTGSVKSENSINNQEPTASFSESKNNPNPSCLNFQGLKVEEVDAEEVQSPENPIWEGQLFPHPYSSSHHHAVLHGGKSSQMGKAHSPLRNVIHSPMSRYAKQEGVEFPVGTEEFIDNPRTIECIQKPKTLGELFNHSPMWNPSKFGASLLNQVGLPRGCQRIEERDVHPAPPPPPPQQLQRKLGHGLKGSLATLREPPEYDSGLQLVHLLLVCAESIAKADYMLAKEYLNKLNGLVTPLGDSLQRVASCFTDALGARLAIAFTYRPTLCDQIRIKPYPQNSPETLKVYQILYQACPYAKFAHFTANQVIFEAFEAEECVHVIDLDILQGYQWTSFMQALAARPGGPPFLRITGFGFPLETVAETGRCLNGLAQSLLVPFEFHPVSERLENLKPHMFHRRVGEALAVNAVSCLHRVPCSSLKPLLGMIRDQAPKVVTLTEQEASHNGPYFLGRFLEALHYYSAIFDSLDATFPSQSVERAEVEQYIFAPEIKNIVACEGADRVERHEKLEKWKKVMGGIGFKGTPLSENAANQSKLLLGLYTCEGYRSTEDMGSLILGWQDRPILSVSAWRC